MCCSKKTWFLEKILRHNWSAYLLQIPEVQEPAQHYQQFPPSIPQQKLLAAKSNLWLTKHQHKWGGHPVCSPLYYHYVENPDIMGPYLRNYSELPPNFHGFVACDYQVIEDPWSPHYKSPCMKHESKTLCLTSATQNVDTKEKHEAIICIQCTHAFNALMVKSFVTMSQ